MITVQKAHSLTQAKGRANASLGSLESLIRQTAVGGGSSCTFQAPNDEIALALVEMLAELGFDARVDVAADTDVLVSW